MKDLTIIIPAKNEVFLQNTIDDISKNIEGNTEIIVVLDGYLPKPALTYNPNVTIIYNSESVGQRAAINQAAKIAKGKYIMKVDAHCAFDKGFDVKMMADIQPNWTLIPQMKNLHVFDWLCEDGHRHYQGQSGPCVFLFDGNNWFDPDLTPMDKRPEIWKTYRRCNKITKKDIVWTVKHNPTSITYRFDKDLHFQYWKDLSKRQTGDLVETMSIQGSCFMCTKEKYWELGLCGEEFNSWGQQGVEVACKTWLSGGKVMVTKKTWYCHLFRTQGGDFGFPYHNPESKIQANRELSKKLFQQNTWPKAIHSFQWLIDKFSPIPGWEDYKPNIPTKGVIYYTHNGFDQTKIGTEVKNRLQKISDDKNIPIVSASDKKIDFGIKNIHFPTAKAGWLSMFKKIVATLEHSTADIVYFAEHDVLYHPSHFDFTPPDKDTFCYNQNVWFLRSTDGHALHYDVNQLSGLCVYREAALKHFRERLELTENGGFDRYKIGFEPFTHNRYQWKNQFKCGTWKSEAPNLDIKHNSNATGQRWNKNQYRNQRLLINWQESEGIVPGWGNIMPIIESMK